VCVHRVCPCLGELLAVRDALGELGGDVPLPILESLKARLELVWLELGTWDPSREKEIKFKMLGTFVVFATLGTARLRI
jgi:hypothetical protein